VNGIDLVGVAQLEEETDLIGIERAAAAAQEVEQILAARHWIGVVSRLAGGMGVFIWERSPLGIALLGH
jgi:hypothetical protein